MSRLALLVCPVFLLLGACSSGWQYLEVEDVSYGDLFNITAYMIDSNGFMIEDQNTNTGVILTQWEYNGSLDVGRFPIRRRAEAHIDPKGDGLFDLGLRIEREALWNRKGPDELSRQEGWEAYGYDKDKTREILGRIRRLLKDFEPSQEFYDRINRMQRMRESIPKFLDHSKEEG